MLSTQTGAAPTANLGVELEEGRLVHFPRCPIELPTEEDLSFLREELPTRIKKKNASYHPEADCVVGVEGNAEFEHRVRRILVAHSDCVQAFLHESLPGLSREWTVGTTSFRPLQEQGRNLSDHASNELVHVDAGAYGATNGDRILRFFVNVHPSEDRVWATRGTFPDLLERYGTAAGVSSSVEKGALDHVRTGVVKGLSAAGLKLAKVIDSSPYDRTMRRFHNYMKDSQEFRAARDCYQEFRFAPFSSWMVLTDMVSHACLSGQHAFVTTFLLRLSSCGRPELAPINILRKHPARGHVTSG